ncbi:hypothetical protein [Streptosporangium sp. NPDC002524]|uniref:hypothetical protein n=1 Tax=Streptosporangium sp. NPDC002524 TaxID=3154537 RepID=UPI00331F478A
MLKPPRLLARDSEWSMLTEFVTHPDPRLRLGVLSGRRRVGKSYLLRALADTMDGLYVSAVAEEGTVAARRRFADDLARYAGVSSGLFRDDAGLGVPPRFGDQPDHATARRLRTAGHR